MKSLENLTNGELLFICFIIFAAVLIFPRLMKRRRIMKEVFKKKSQGLPITPEDFTGKNKLPYSHNAQRQEVEELLAKLKTYAFKHEMKVIFPGNFRYKEEVSPTTMILAGSFGLLLIRCYGFGGHIYTEEAHRWMQNMNEEIKEIKSPVESMKREKNLMTSALSQGEFKNVPVYTASVFTRHSILLSLPEPCNVFTRTEFMEWLEREAVFAADKKVPVKKITETIVAMIKQA